MASDNGDSPDEARRSRHVIHEAQEKCLNWQEICLGAHHGFARVDDRLARRAFHNSVMQYWAILRPYRNENAISDEWGSDEFLELAPYHVGNISVSSLDELGRLRYAERVEYDIERDPVMGTRRSERRAPAYLDAHEASDVFDALNDAAEKLGFLARATKSTPQTEIDRELVDKVNDWWENDALSNSRLVDYLESKGAL